MFKRNIQKSLLDAIGDTPVILVIGGRQTGKSTLVQSLRSENYQPQYYTFDDLTVLNAAATNP